MAQGTDPGPPGPGAGRHIATADLHQLYRPLLPERGVLAGGGGFVSTTWRVVVDLTSSRLTAARTDQEGAAIFGDLAEVTERALSTRERQELDRRATALLDPAWLPTPQTIFTADSESVLVLTDGPAAFELMPAGPITEGPEAEIHSLLYRLAWPQN